MTSDTQNENHSKTYHIRLVTADDNEAITAINRRAWSGGITTAELLEQRHGVLDGTPWIEQITNDVVEHLVEPGVTVFVAEQESRVVGYAAAEIKPEKPEVGIVSYNAVDPDHQGRGIGTTLTRQVMGYLKNQGARVLVVWTLETDEPARHVYERLGFKELTRFVYYSMAGDE